MNRLLLVCASVKGASVTLLNYHSSCIKSLIIWTLWRGMRTCLLRGDAGLQLLEGELHGDHLGADLLQTPASLWAAQGVGQQPGISARLHGEGGESLKTLLSWENPFIVCPMSGVFTFVEADVLYSYKTAGIEPELNVSNPSSCSTV